MQAEQETIQNRAVIVPSELQGSNWSMSGALKELDPLQYLGQSASQDELGLMHARSWPVFRNRVFQIGNCKTFGRPIFWGRTQYTQIWVSYVVVIEGLGPNDTQMPC